MIQFIASEVVVVPSGKKALIVVLNLFIPVSAFPAFKKMSIRSLDSFGSNVALCDSICSRTKSFKFETFNLQLSIFDLKNNFIKKVGMYWLRKVRVKASIPESMNSSVIFTTLFSSSLPQG